MVPGATFHAPTAMVCSVDHLASQAGVSTMRAGGSAADAAVATSAVLAVTTQHMCGMGGDLFALVHDGVGPPAVLNASGRAGSGADPDALRAEGHTVMPFRDDIRSVPIPGCVDGWLALHSRFGRLGLDQVLAPAIAYAEDGFPASPTLADAIPMVAHLTGASDYTVMGNVRPGTLIRRPGVGSALRAIASGGRKAWYEGQLGEGLSLLGPDEYTTDDLSTPQAEWVDPLGITAFDHKIWTVPPNSQGYLTLAGAWIAEGLDLPEGPDGPDDPLWAHLLVESARHAGHDRPDVLYEHADGTALIDPARLGPRRYAIDRESAASDLPGLYGHGGTIHLVAVDGNRMGVSLIQSNAAGWGAHLVVPGARVFLQNRGVGFSLQPGHLAEYGPRRRPPHTLAPALVTGADDRLAMVIGTMGGDSQPQVLLQILTRLLLNGQQPGQAISAGRFALAGGGTGFETWAGRGTVTVGIEGHAPPPWRDGLSARGHAVEVAPPWSHRFGHAHVIEAQGALLAGASDPRPGIGQAAGF